MNPINIKLGVIEWRLLAENKAAPFVNREAWPVCKTKPEYAVHKALRIDHG